MEKGVVWQPVFLGNISVEKILPGTSGVWIAGQNRFFFVEMRNRHFASSVVRLGTLMKSRRPI